MKIEKRIPVSQGPAHVIIDDNDTAYVTTRFGHQLHKIDLISGTDQGHLLVGSEPQGLTLLHNGNIAIALSGESAIAIVDPQELVVTEKIDLPDNDPRAVAQDNQGRLIVNHMSSGRMSVIDENFVFSKSISMSTRVNTGPAVHPNHVRLLTMSPDGSRVVMAHSQSNDQIIRAPIDPAIVEALDMEPSDSCEPAEEEEGCGSEDSPEIRNETSSDCGYGGCADELGAVVPTITKVDLTDDTVVIPTKERQTDSDFAFQRDPATILNPSSERFGFNSVAIHNPVGSALIDGGRGILIINTGTQNAVLLRNDGMDGSPGDMLGEASVGHGPSGLAISHDGTTAYIFNLFEGTITEIELPTIHSQAQQTEDSLMRKTEDANGDFSHGFSPAQLHSETYAILDDALPADIVYGRILFHDATDERISGQGSVSCASCHPDGRSDNVTWQFTFGPRNTPQLGGGILETAPFHWPGDVTTFNDLETATVQAFMGGHGLGEDMGVVASYMDALPAAPSRSDARAELTPGQANGKLIFESAQAACTTCHSGRHFTNNANMDIGSKARPSDRSDFQVPVMHGLERSAPYMHDGSAKNLKELVYQWVKTDRMGKGSHLTDADLNDLIRFLETL
jgi:DNA-binding beta-propeller fold protein YncE